MKLSWFPRVAYLVRHWSSLQLFNTIINNMLNMHNVIVYDGRSMFSKVIND